MAEKERLKWIDIIKGISMICIVLSHTGCPRIYERLYTPFFLTAFFFVSGYTFSLKKSFSQFFVKKVQSLIIPLICFGFINVFIAFLQNKDRAYLKLKGMFLQQMGNYDDFWFLACLFTALMIFYFIVKISKNNIYVILLLSFFISFLGYLYISNFSYKLYWQLEGSMILIMWVALGYAYRIKEHIFERFINFNSLVLCIVIYVIIVLLYDNFVNIRLEIYNNIYIHLISSLVGIACVVLVSKLINSNSILEFIGMNSLIYYALQSKSIKVWEKALTLMGINFGEYFQSILITVLSCVLIVPFVYIINKYVPFVLGKSFNSRKNQ